MNHSFGGFPLGGVVLKILAIVLMLLMLTGCGTQTVWETVEDQWMETAAACRTVTVDLPKEAAAPALQNTDGSALYLCDGYTLTVQTFAGGDLDATVRQLTGFSLEQLTCIQTQCDAWKQYSCVWSAVGEGGDHVGRAVILDDGSYHYAVSVMADFEAAGDLTQTWQEILNSVELSDTD